MKAVQDQNRALLSCCRSMSGGDRNRTCDIQLAKLALSQLSYTPMLWKAPSYCEAIRMPLEDENEKEEIRFLYGRWTRTTNSRF